MQVSGRRQGGSDDLSTGFLCDPCKGVEEEENAEFYCTVCNEYLCNTCAKVHKRHKLSKHHKLLDRDNMPTQKITSSMEGMCSKHNTKFVEYYCKIHEDCCCSVCVNLDHKQCKVEYIDDLSIGYETSKEYTSLVRALAGLTQLLQRTRTIGLKNKDEVGRIHSKFISDVKTFRSEINQILDSLEQRILKEAQTAMEKDTTSTESASTTCDAIIADLNEMSSHMEQQTKYKQQRQLVITAKKAQNQIQQFEIMTTELDSRCSIRDYMFTPNETIIQALKAVNSIGYLENNRNKETKTKIERKEKTSAPNKSVSLRYIGDINIEHSSDTSKYGCWITGGVMLDNNMLALADKHNSSVKIVDVSNNKVISCIKLPTCPWDITRVEPEQIVLTCGHQLVFVKVGKTLSVMKALDVGGESCGIVYTNKTFICSFIDPVCVKIIDLGGKILKTITTDIRGQTLFESPLYIALSRDQNTLYVSDMANNSVTSMDLNGNVQHVYKHEKLKGLRGVAVDKDDNIYIAGYKSCNIHIISPQCTTIRVVQDGTPGINVPCAVIYCEKDNRLYISHNSNDRISVYQID